MVPETVRIEVNKTIIRVRFRYWHPMAWVAIARMAWALRRQLWSALLHG
jgi:hypothetical protein